MDKFEIRVTDKNGNEGIWVEAIDHQAVLNNVFGLNSRYLYSVRYTYKDGSFIEYRKINLK